MEKREETWLQITQQALNQLYTSSKLLDEILGVPETGQLPEVTVKEVEALGMRLHNNLIDIRRVAGQVGVKIDKIHQWF